MKRRAAAMLLAALVLAIASLLGGEVSARLVPESLLQSSSRESSHGLQAQAPIRRAPTPPHGLGASSSQQSYNWAGYDATGGGFTSVSATWTQPTIQPDAATDSVASFWVGLDGDGSSTVEQLGTQAENYYGSVTYSAWWEMYPAYETPISTMTISPGDLMSATVTAGSSGNFTLALSDHSTGAQFTTTQHSAVAQGHSAEVIAEAPTNGLTNTVYPLPEFGTADFSGCALNGRPLSAFAYNQIDMVSQSSGATLAATSPLGSDGASFSVASHPGAVPAPSLTSFAPASGPVGTVVTLTGTGFTGAIAVRFNGTAASFSVNSDTRVTATVPAAASSGPISVTTPGGSATTATSFTVTALSSDDTLSSLTVSAGTLTPSFAASTLIYGDSVANSVASISLTPTTNESHASYVLTMGGAPVTNPIALNVGANVIDVEVRAQNGARETYSVTVTRAALVIPALTLKLSGLTSGAYRLGKYLTATGKVTPTSLAGRIKVTLTLQRLYSGKWHPVTTASVKIATNGAYSWTTYKPSRRGSYRVRASISKTNRNAGVTTTWRRFTVK